MEQRFWQRIRFIRWLLFLAMAGAAVAIFVGLKVRSAERILPAAVAKVTNEDGSLTLNNFEYRDVKEGNARWTVWASTATYFEDRQETVLDQLRAVFFLKKGGQVVLTGDEGILHTDTNNMEISSNVVVSYGDDCKMTTDRLLYDRDKELIYTEAELIIEGQGFTVKGEGMRLEIAKRTVSVLKHIETTLQGIVSFGDQRQRVS